MSSIIGHLNDATDHLRLTFESAVVEFADPHIRYGLRFQTAETPPAEEPPPAEPEPPPAKDPEPGQVVSLDAFRRRSPQE